jgi:ABC-type glycerol-3-phosphate transport system substrate-binding protein
MMRILTLIALGAVMLGLGACAKDEPTTTATSSHSTGYSK